MATAKCPMPPAGFSSNVRGTASPRNFAVGGNPGTNAADFTNTTPATTETYMGEILVSLPCRVKGLAVMAGSVWSDNVTVALLDDAGNVLAQSATTAGSTTADAYQLFPFATAVDLSPGTYYAAVQLDGTTSRINTHTIGAFGGAKATGTTYGTFTGLTVPRTFTTAVAPVATLY